MYLTLIKGESVFCFLGVLVPCTGLLSLRHNTDVPEHPRLQLVNVTAVQNVLYCHNKIFIKNSLHFFFKLVISPKKCWLLRVGTCYVTFTTSHKGKGPKICTNKHHENINVSCDKNVFIYQNHSQKVTNFTVHGGIQSFLSWFS